MPEAEDYRGLSLHVMRRLTHTELRYRSAAEARVDSFVEDREPDLGDIVWYHSDPHGNVALCVGHERVAGVSELTGKVAVMPYQDPQLGSFAGVSTRIGP